VARAKLDVMRAMQESPNRRATRAQLIPDSPASAMLKICEQRGLIDRAHIGKQMRITAPGVARGN